MKSMENAPLVRDKEMVEYADYVIAFGMVIVEELNSLSTIVRQLVENA